jgi:hypothetical protein
MGRPPTYDPVPLKKGECFCSRKRIKHVFGDGLFAGDSSLEEVENDKPSTCKCIKENEKKKRKRAVTQAKNYFRRQMKKEYGDNYYSVFQPDRVASSSTDANAPMNDIR